MQGSSLPFNPGLEGELQTFDNLFLEREFLGQGVIWHFYGHGKQQKPLIVHTET